MIRSTAVKEVLIYRRNQVFHLLYTSFLKKVFFKIDPETVHERMTDVGQTLGQNRAARLLTRLAFHYRHPALEQKILGIKFPNPIGLAAGFDKDARLTRIIPEVGFGFMEVGSISGEPSEGNPKPRLWRLQKSRGLVVNFGLNNDGCERIARKLKRLKFKVPLFTSVVKTNCPETVETKAGIKDYLKAYRAMSGIGQATTINISCPNAYGGTAFSDPVKLEKLLKKLAKIPAKKPIFLKMPPDLSRKNIDDLIGLAGKYRLAGFICSNLTKDKNRMKGKIKEKSIPEKGGISGKVVEELANEQIKYIYKKTQGKFIIIGCGGVFSAEDAYKKIKLGASLIQMITGMVFEGPQVISQINQGLVRLLCADGYTNISQAIGKWHYSTKA